MTDARPCDYLNVGDPFSWTTIGGEKIRGTVKEIDSNVVIVVDEHGQEHCYES